VADFGNSTLIPKGKKYYKLKRKMMISAKWYGAVGARDFAKVFIERFKSKCVYSRNARVV